MQTVHVRCLLPHPHGKGLDKDYPLSSGGGVIKGVNTHLRLVHPDKDRFDHSILEIKTSDGKSISFKDIYQILGWSIHTDKELAAKAEYQRKRRNLLAGKETLPVLHKRAYRARTKIIVDSAPTPAPEEVPVISEREPMVINACPNCGCQTLKQVNHAMLEEERATIAAMKTRFGGTR